MAAALLWARAGQWQEALTVLDHRRPVDASWPSAAVRERLVQVVRAAVLRAMGRPVADLEIWRAAWREGPGRLGIIAAYLLEQVEGERVVMPPDEAARGVVLPHEVLFARQVVDSLAGAPENR